MMRNRLIAQFGTLSTLIILFGWAGISAADGQQLISEHVSDDQQSSMQEQGASNRNVGNTGALTFSGSESRSESAGLTITISPEEESDGVCEMEEGVWNLPEFCGWGETTADAAAAAMAAINDEFGSGAAASGDWTFTISPDN